MPLVETSERASTDLFREVLREVRELRRGFENWLALTLAIAISRLEGRPAALQMRARRGPILQTPSGDRSWWTAVECFGRDCYRLQEQGLPPAPTVVDIGANIGSFTLAVLALRPRAHVTAYEASPAAIRTLTANLAANGVASRVQVEHRAVTGRAEVDTVWLSEHEGDLCTSSIVGLGRDTFTTSARIEVPSTSLSAVLASHPDGIDLLKMDVEGAEFEIVKATPAEQLASVARVVIEYHDVPGHRVEELAERLGAAGLVWERQEHSNRAGQGLAWWVRETGP
jgi:FkbM family methyltransferase